MVEPITANALVQYFLGLSATIPTSGSGAGNVVSGTITIPPNIYVGLSTTKPEMNYNIPTTQEQFNTGAGGTTGVVNVTEPPASAGYKRVLIGFPITSGQIVSDFRIMGNPVNGKSKSKRILFFNELDASWGTVKYILFFRTDAPASKSWGSGGAGTGFEYFQSSSGGSNLILWDEIKDSSNQLGITPGVGYVPIIRAGDLTIGLNKDEVE